MKQVLMILICLHIVEVSLTSSLRMLVKRRNIGAHGIASVYEGRTPTTAKRNICKKIDSSFSSWKTGPNFTSFCDTSSCCRVPDSLKFVSWNGTQFCVSWSIKDSLPCDSSIGATIRYKKEGTTTWTTVDVTYATGQKKYTYCDTATNCRYYDWQVRTKCKRMGVITYSAYKNGPQFLLNKNCGPIPKSAPVVNAIDDDALKLLINPNPVTSELTVSTNKLLSGSYQLTIVDAVGRTRIKQNVVVSQKMLQVKLSTGKLGSGVYYVIVKGRDEVIKRSFVSY